MGTSVSSYQLTWPDYSILALGVCVALHWTGIPSGVNPDQNKAVPENGRKKQKTKPDIYNKLTVSLFYDTEVISHGLIQRQVQ